MKACVAAAVVTAAVAAFEASAAQRTFVRSDGVDTNPCSIVAPCRSFAAAIAVTDPAGEIVVLDSGGYGRVSVGKSVTIAAPPGVYAGVSVFGGTNGIDVSAAGSTVVLRGLAINGQGGSHGIDVAAAAEVHIEQCVVSNMDADGIHITSGGAVYVDHVIVRSNGGNGIDVAGGGPQLFVDDTRIANNAVTGVLLTSGHATLNRVAVDNNGFVGVDVVPNSGADPRLSVRDSLIAENGGNGVALGADAGETARAEFEHTSIVRNGSTGLVIQSAGGAVSAHASNINASGNAVDGVAAFDAMSTLTVSGSTMTRNVGYGIHQLNSSTVRSPGNNVVDGNQAGPTNGTITPITLM